MSYLPVAARGSQSGVGTPARLAADRLVSSIQRNLVFYNVKATSLAFQSPESLTEYVRAVSGT